MIRRIAPAMLLLTILITATAGQDADKLISGPQKGESLPGPCEVFNINGTKHKDRFHCLVCEYGFDPVVMIFAQEPKDGDDGPLNALTRRLETSLEQNKELSLRAFLVVMSKDFRSSATEKVDETDKIVKETQDRLKLLDRLKNRAAKMKSVILACTGAEGPRIYKLDPRAEVTVIFYNRLKVVENYAFAAGKMTEEDVDRIMVKVETTLKRPNK